MPFGKKKTKTASGGYPKQQTTTVYPAQQYTNPPPSTGPPPAYNPSQPYYPGQPYQQYPYQQYPQQQYPCQQNPAQQPQKGGAVVFDQGASVGRDGQISIPPPPPGVMPQAGQVAAMQGQSVVGVRQNRDILGGGSDGGYTLF